MWFFCCKEGAFHPFSSLLTIIGLLAAHLMSGKPGEALTWSEWSHCVSPFLIPLLTLERTSASERTSTKIWSRQGRGQTMCLHCKAEPWSWMFQKHEEKPSVDHEVRVDGCISGRTDKIRKKGWEWGKGQELQKRTEVLIIKCNFINLIYCEIIWQFCGISIPMHPPSWYMSFQLNFASVFLLVQLKSKLS